MEPIKHIRLSGHADAFALTAAANDRLLGYLAEARSALRADPDGDETVRDLEVMLGDRLRILLEDDPRPVDDPQIARILDEAGTVQGQQPTPNPAPSPGQGVRGSFWCRIDEGKWFGGVCAGIAARGNLRLDWVRVFAIIFTLATSGVLALVYVALMVFLPRVSTVEEYRRLRDAPRPLHGGI
jgi:phage shock protein C